MPGFQPLVPVPHTRRTWEVTEATNPTPWLASLALAGLLSLIDSIGKTCTNL